ncbi:MAG: flagellar assembly protein FliH [Betaproteobacteria bacterium]|nr:flagellar assembly protein FliH [Betaproteobacteria bacterium]
MQTNNFISKEKLNSCQRWELDTFETPSEIQDSTTNTPTTEEEQGENNPQNSQNEEQAALIFQQAKEEGHAEGYKNGHNDGYEAGRQEAEAEVKAEVAKLQTLLSELGQNLQLIDQQVSEDLLALALDLAKKMISQALKIQPEIILPIVQEAMRCLPSTTQHPHLFLHPDDAKLIRQHLADQISQDHWEIRENDQLSRGGCYIEVNGSSIDASPETRWRRILSTIGKEDNWLETKDQHDT